MGQKPGLYLSAAPEPVRASPRLLCKPALFRPEWGDETKIRRDETILSFSEDIRKPPPGITYPTTQRATKAHDRGPS
jgi:hypothetical protein